jgi:hypothetical protein
MSHSFMCPPSHSYLACLIIASGHGAELHIVWKGGHCPLLTHKTFRDDSLYFIIPWYVAHLHPQLGPKTHLSIKARDVSQKCVVLNPYHRGPAVGLIRARDVSQKRHQIWDLGSRNRECAELDLNIAWRWGRAGQTLRTSMVSPCNSWNLIWISPNLTKFLVYTSTR